MSQLKAKQIAGPSSGKVGSAILFDGTKSGWSADLNTALSLPSGPTSARPQTAAGGHIRHNSETGKLEGFNGTSWIDLGISKFTELSDGPGALQAGKGLRVNSGGTALEYYTLFTGIARYRFKVNMLSNGNPGTFENIPDGWTVTIVNTDDLVITHNLGKEPLMVFTYGKNTTVSANGFMQRTPAQTTINLTYDASDLNSCKVLNVTQANTSASTGTFAYVDLYFMT